MLKFRLLLIIPALFVAGCGSRGDDELLEKFEQNRGQLDELVLMFDEDVGLTRVTQKSTVPENPADADVTFERIARYRELCKLIEAEGCIEGVEPEPEPMTPGQSEEEIAAAEAEASTDKTVIWIHMDDRADDASGERRGYLYSHQPPFQVVKDLDDVRLSASSTWLQQIDGPWYLYLDYRD